MINISELPLHFSGSVFAAKYKLTENDFWFDCNSNFTCPSLPHLTREDLLDCVAAPLPSTEERLEAAELMIDLLLDTQQEAP